ncbi:hypothetical protein [Polymorphobacter sp.]|uniref:hypothetical protein n=1 Tax=Polymorphobacter sp. TaxID=1909290 RepID=UPI003F70E6A0
MPKKNKIRDAQLAAARDHALARLANLSGAEGDYSLRMARCVDSLRALARLHDNEFSAVLEIIADDFERCCYRAEIDSMAAYKAA